MAGVGSDELARVDPILIERFALFREPGSPDPLDAQHLTDLEEVLAARGVRRLGLIGSLARAVRVRARKTVSDGRGRARVRRGAPIGARP